MLERSVTQPQQENSTPYMYLSAEQIKQERNRPGYTFETEAIIKG
jgi:hypothetical protein